MGCYFTPLTLMWVFMEFRRPFRVTSPVRTCVTVSRKSRKIQRKPQQQQLKEHLSVSAAPADCLAPLDARTSACTMMTKFRYPPGLNSSPPGKNGRHFADDIFKCIFVNEKFCILITISLKFVPKGPIDNNIALAWRRIAIMNNADPIHWHIYAALGGDEW